MTGTARASRAWPSVLALLVLSPIAAEYLAAYDDTTGNAPALLGGLLVFAPLYGGPALLIREFARRTGRGWPSMLLLAAAFGVVQAGLVDQSLFADSFDGISGWQKTLEATYVAPLGVGAYYAQSFVLGHVVYSFCAPIALVEAMHPERARAGWLRPRGAVLLALAWLAAAALVLSDLLGAPAAERGTAPELAGAAALALALAVAALVLGRRPPRARVSTGGRTVVAALAASFVLATIASAVPETWTGFVLAIVATLAGGLLLLRLAAGGAHGSEAAAAVAAGALISRAVLAFTYFPVVGVVGAGPKYAHNAAMLVLAAGVGAVAIRRARVATAS